MARPAAYPSLPQPGEAGALERDAAGVASPQVHTHPGVVAHSVGDDELTAALMLGHGLGTCTCRNQTGEMDETREDIQSSARFSTAVLLRKRDLYARPRFILRR